MHILRITLLMAGALALAVPVLADPPWAREGGSKHEKHDKHEKRDKRAKHDAFNDDDRVMIRNYYTANPTRVPPGLAKKGGVPPGLAKKGGMPPGLARGEVMSDAHYRQLLPLPPDLDKLLPPPPHEVARMILDHHIVLVHKQTHKILDVLHDALP
jgi:hypothetical protein